MPSVSAMMVPTSRASAFASKFWIRCRIRSLISDALIAMFVVLEKSFDRRSGRLAHHRARELLEPRAHGAIDDHVLCAHDCTADQRRVDLERELDFAPQPLLERLLDACRDAGVDGRRRDELRL